MNVSFYENFQVFLIYKQVWWIMISAFQFPFLSYFFGCLLQAIQLLVQESPIKFCRICCFLSGKFLLYKLIFSFYLFIFLILIVFSMVEVLHYYQKRCILKVQSCEYKTGSILWIFFLEVSKYFCTIEVVFSFFFLQNPFALEMQY